MKYNKEYFETGNYKNYSERELKYTKLSEELVKLLSELNLINKNYSIIDYGCGTGHLVKAFKNLNYNIVGLDISEYAINEAKDKSLPVEYIDINSEHLSKLRTDVFICLDVLEHMVQKDVKTLFDKLDCICAIIRIPVASKYLGDFHLKISRKDATHINCKTANEWKVFFQPYFSTILDLNLTSIYSSKGVISLLLIK